jgi:hypothetical protein
LTIKKKNKRKPQRNDDEEGFNPKQKEDVEQSSNGPNLSKKLCCAKNVIK